MSEPLAIVGAACRLPGGISDLDGLWAALKTGRDLVTEVPRDRFNATRYVDPNPVRPGKSYTLAGGFLDDITGFDADFFGIVPREASRIDPQQRLILELAVEALDDAAIDPASAAGTEIGVYVGVSAPEYWTLQHGDPASINAYTSAGGMICNTANRVSYTFDLHGPSMAIDTACSSALVAFHQACEYVRSGGPAALAAGVNVMLNPYIYIGHAKASLLSPTGRCHAFSDHPDGYVRAEGGGLVVLKRLTTALAAGDRIHAVVLGTSSNSDGRTVGLALPNPQAQEDLLRATYRRAGVDPDELVYYEAHGTGTAVGDAFECMAIGKALAVRRTRPLPIGSVKTNVGHLEPASGMAGLMKALLVLRHRMIPPSLHGTPHNPEIDFAGLGLAPVDVSEPLCSTIRSVVGVSAFGFGGSNAHVVLAAAPQQGPQAEITGPLPLVVSARSQAALTEAVGLMADRVELASPAEFYDLCYTATRRRGHHPHRAAVLAERPHQAAADLREVVESTHAVPDGRVVFAFSGNGSQWAGMGVGLLAAEPAFAAAIEAVDAAFAPLAGWSVLDELRTDTGGSPLAAAEVAQPCLFAMQLGLVAVLDQRGVRPQAVYGHSNGEVAAAYVSGALTVEQAVRVVWARSTVHTGTAGTGRMAAVGLSEAEATSELVRFGDKLEIAGVNSDRQVTIAGESESLSTLEVELLERGVFFRTLPMDYAYHSFLMDGTEPMLRERLGTVRPAPARIPFVSTVTGTPMTGAELDTDYWWANLRRPVQFAAATTALITDGFGIFCEIGPHPVLGYYLREQVPAVTYTLRRDCDGPAAMRNAVASLVACGARIGWEQYFPQPGRVIELPAYPWQRERHWNGNPDSWGRGSGSALSAHPLLGDRIGVFAPTWQGPLEVGRVAWLGDHYVHDAVVVPGAAYIDMALAAGTRGLPEPDGPVEMHNLRISNALALPDDPAATLTTQVSLSSEDGVIHIASRLDEAQQWRVHARARVRRLAVEAPPPLDLAAVRAGLSGPAPSTDLYAWLASVNVTYRGSFDILTEVWIGDDEVLARYATALPLEGYGAHPVILDGALQAALALPRVHELTEIFLPASVGSVRLWVSPGREGFIRVRIRSLTETDLHFDVMIITPDGTVAVEIDDCWARRFARPAGVLMSRIVTELRAVPEEMSPVEVSPLPAPDELIAAATPDFVAARADLDSEGVYSEYAPRLTAHFAVAAVTELLGACRTFHVDDLLAAGVAARYRRMLGALLGLAHRNGLAEPVGERWRLLASGCPEAVFEQALADHPGNVTMLTVIGRAGRHLVEVLRGHRDPVELLFGQQSLETMRNLYERAPAFRFHNRRAQALVRRMVQAWPGERPLRILEIGAGTGGMTGWLLPVLPPERTRYVFTDVSEAFFAKAAARFAAYDFVDYRLLDIDRDPVDQGFAAGSVDLVVAANCLHASQDLQRTARYVAHLLGSGGQLLLMESHRVDTVLLPSGLFDGYWAFTDTDLRTESPLLSPEAWREVLTRSGFDLATSVDIQDLAREDNSLLLARRAAQPLTEQAPTERETSMADTGWLVVTENGDELGLAADLASRLGARVVNAATDRIEPGPHAKIALILSEPPEPVVAIEVTIRRFAMLQAILAAINGTGATMCLITRPTGALPAPEEPATPADAALWGAVRGIAAERWEVSFRRISLARGERDAERLAVELRGPGDEDEVVLTRAGRFVPRLVELTTPTGSCDHYALRIRDRGRGYRLDWQQAAAPRAGQGEVMVTVRGAALNYKDVLLANGVLTAEHVEGGLVGTSLGMEYAGVVDHVGPGVTRFRAGDRVFGYGPDSFASHVVAPATRLGLIPDRMSYSEAATLPVVFLVMEYVGPFQAGQTVLVHGGAGATGLAAIQHARRAGATVIATAGTEDKRDVLRLLGIEHVLDSRSLAFAEQVREITHGRGVDVVLNSLAGEAMARSLELVAPMGRFIELGKVDLYADRSVSLRPFRTVASYLAFDLDRAMGQFPERTAAHFAALVKRVAAGDLRPLPYRTYPAARISEAFATLQHSRHIGKIVVTFDEAPPVSLPRQTPHLDPAGTYLISGGLSGLGAATATWLVDRGARNLVLLSRRGPDAPEAPAILAELTRRGAVVTAHAADITDPAAVRSAIDATGRPLRGVVHAAVSYDDGPLETLTPDRIRAVLLPKMLGSAVLDQLTRTERLDLFLVLGSQVGVFGYDNQSNYAAGNVFGEALVRHRRQAGLPACLIALGRIGDVGWLARHDEVAQAMDRRGIFSMPPDEVFAAFDDVLGWEIPSSCVVRNDWELAAPYLIRGVPRCGALVAGERDANRGVTVAAQLADTRADELPALVEDALAGLVASVLSADPGRLDRTRSLDTLGVDSLMSTEITDLIRREFGVEIPVTRVMTSGGIGDLAHFVHAGLTARRP